MTLNWGFMPFGQGQLVEAPEPSTTGAWLVLSQQMETRHDCATAAYKPTVRLLLTTTAPTRPPLVMTGATSGVVINTGAVSCTGVTGNGGVEVGYSTDNGVAMYRVSGAFVGDIYLRYTAPTGAVTGDLAPTNGGSRTKWEARVSSGSDYVTYLATGGSPPSVPAMVKGLSDAVAAVTSGAFLDDVAVVQAGPTSSNELQAWTTTTGGASVALTFRVFVGTTGGIDTATGWKDTTSANIVDFGTSAPSLAGFRLGSGESVTA